MHPDRPFQTNGATVPAGGSAANRPRDGLSLQTLVIAAVASGIAAIVTSHFWKSGTAVAAAMTPVVVSLIKEGLQRPLESERVRRPVSRVSEMASARRAVAGVAAARTEAVQRSAPGVGSNVPPPPPPPPTRTNGGPAVETAGDALLSPRRNYASGTGTLTTRRKRQLKLAVVTGLLAFVIAALVLTVPELVFGGAVSSNRGTTIFGGGSKSSQSDKTKADSKNSSDKSKQQDNNKNTQTTPSQQSQQPTQTQPQQTTPSQQSSPQPQQPAPSGSAPAPSSPPPSSSPSPPAP